MKKFDDVLKFIEKWIGIILMFAMLLSITLQIVFRWTKTQVAWTEELARYLFVVVTYYGALYATRNHSHLKVELLETLTGKKGKFVFRLITNISSIIFYIFLTKIMADYLKYLTRIKQTSAVLKLDIRIIYLAPLIFAIVGIYELAKDTIFVIKTKEVN